MCGIVGFNWEDADALEEACNCITHRGPDQEGRFVGQGVSIGHQRLSILDLSEKGRQPMWDSDRTVSITFNGEIFNYLELRDELTKQGYSFRSNTDTEVLVYGYKEWGLRLLDRIQGQFAFCIYDSLKQQFFLARDRMGVLPLYYFHDSRRFGFASQLKSLLAVGVEKRISSQALDFYVMFGYTPRGQSIFADVKKLLPGHYLVFDLQENEVSVSEAYWELSFSPELTDLAEAAKQLRATLDKAIKKRLMADVPVGTFLSGGLDSSTIVALMSQYTKDLHTFSIKFDKVDFDESAFARQVSEKFDTIHHEFLFTSQDVRDTLQRLPEFFDEPFADHSMIPQFLLSQHTREYVTVALSGDGGDELFGGYETYKLFRLVKNEVPYVGWFARLPLPTKLKRFLRYHTLKPYQRFANLNSYWYVEDVNASQLSVYEPYKEFFDSDDWLTNAINADVHIFLPEDILVKVDRASLAHNLEVRPPFLDREVVELSARMHSSLKLHGTNGKQVLKDAIDDLLPAEILNRKKKGFGSPITHYFRDELADLVHEFVLNYDEHDHFSHLDLSRMWHEYSSGQTDYSRHLFTVMMFNLWWDRWM